ncbi:MAG: aldolase catalytic domain-containing protein [Litorivicinaceae bacterium]|nr:aldolase catalytic domain-containing protein [Litorivicinaceae bacterium]
MSNNLNLVDCTLRDGGYYNNWDFSRELIDKYLAAMAGAKVDVVELGFRFLRNDGFQGPCAFTTDDFLRSLDIPSDLSVAVMVNGADLYTDMGWQSAMERLFPEVSEKTPVDLVRFACHFHELTNAVSAANWLVDRGYRVGLNLMQITDRTQTEVEYLGELAKGSGVDVLYFADSTGSLTTEYLKDLVGWLRKHWSGPLGIHAHDNMRLALANTLCAHSMGVTWLDATVTGMGRGAGNARTEDLLIDLGETRVNQNNIVPLMELIQEYFWPMKIQCGWGTNSYYYLAGKYGIHPSYIQEMLADRRYGVEDILAVIAHLRKANGKKFNVHTLEGALHFYRGEPRGIWVPAEIMKDREVLILGAGPSVALHRTAIESYIGFANPIVIALNTHSGIDIELIDMRVACHPVRLLADADRYATFPQPLITPVSMLPAYLLTKLKGTELLDYGLGVEKGVYEFYETFCKSPSPLVLAYALAVVTSGAAARILMAGFDGFDRGDIRNDEVEHVLSVFGDIKPETELFSITPTKYRNLTSRSIYGVF